MKTLNDYSSYQKNFSESRMWDKISKVAYKAGVKLYMRYCYSSTWQATRMCP